jgi:threonyl-tRNA synthetase
MESGQVSVRSRSAGDQGGMNLSDFIARMKTEAVPGHGLPGEGKEE